MDARTLDRLVAVLLHSVHGLVVVLVSLIMVIIMTEWASGSCGTGTTSSASPGRALSHGPHRELDCQSSDGKD